MSEGPAKKPEPGKPDAAKPASGPSWQQAPAPKPGAPSPAPGSPPGSPNIVIQGVKPAAAPDRPDARKILESTAGALGRFLAPVTAKITGKLAPPPPPAEVPAPEPAADEAAAPRPPAAKVVAIPPPKRDANIPHDRIIMRVGAGTAGKANAVLVRKGVRDAKVEGDTLEFEMPSLRVIQLFKALIEGHIELYGLERTTAPAREAAPAPPASDAGAVPQDPPSNH